MSSTIGKVLEKVVYKRLVSFLNSTEILSESQFGFRKSNFIEDAVYLLTKEIQDARESKLEVYGLFLDLTKAFDLVNHQLLLDKLHKYGIRGLAHKWFKSYLEDREQYVELTNNRSNTREVDCGVPQGSILGPILFLL